MTEPSIIVKDASVRYRPYVDKVPTVRKSIARMKRRETREVVALDGVSLEVEKGEALGIIGQNGAGKSTLLRVLAGTLRPSEGTVEFRGSRPTLLQLGVGFNPQLSGRQNVYLGGLASGLSRSRITEVFDEIVEYSELGDAIERPLKTYSSGMSSRLAFSIAMKLNADTLLLDELLAVGDAHFKEKSMESMQELLERAGTIVIVSHSLPRIAALCDRAAWLDGGVLQMVGSAPDVIEAYRKSNSDDMAEETKPELESEQDQYSATEKVNAVLRVIRSRGKAKPIARELGLDVEQLHEWRKEFIAAGRRHFGKS